MAKLAFIQNHWFELQGPMMISSYVKSFGHSVEIFIDRNWKNLIKDLLDYKPDLIAFPTITEDRPWILQTAKKIRERLDSKLLLGGIDPTFSQESISNPFIDFLCVGEGEHLTLELLNTISGENKYHDIKNLVYKSDSVIKKNPLRPLISNLSTLPHPDRGLYYNKYNYLRLNPTKRVFIGRGCPFRCSYCCNSKLHEMYKGLGKFTRLKKVDQVLSEIENMLQLGPVNSIEFSDDTFIMNREFLENFLPIYKKEFNIPYHCLIRLEHLDESLAILLKESGCYLCAFGLESGDEKIRRDILKRYVSDDAIIEKAALLKKIGLPFLTYNILNLPTETYESAIKTVKLNHKIGTSLTTAFIFQPYPGTPILKFAQEQGCLPLDFNFSQQQLKVHHYSVIQQKDSTRLENLHKFFFLAVKFPSMLPFINWIVKLKPNPLFNFIFLVTFAYKRMLTTHSSLIKTILFEFRHVKTYFLGSK